MSQDPIIMGSNVREGVGSNNLILARDVGSRKTGLEVFAQWKSIVQAEKLGGMFNGLLYAICRDETKVGF